MIGLDLRISKMSINPEFQRPESRATRVSHFHWLWVNQSTYRVVIGGKRTGLTYGFQNCPSIQIYRSSLSGKPQKTEKLYRSVFRFSGRTRSGFMDIFVILMSSRFFCHQLQLCRCFGLPSIEDNVKKVFCGFPDKPEPEIRFNGHFWNP